MPGPQVPLVWQGAGQERLQNPAPVRAVTAAPLVSVGWGRALAGLEQHIQAGLSGSCTGEVLEIVFQ